MLIGRNVIGYELIKFAGRHDNLFTRVISAPGVWLQHITTKEPTDDMIECAITAMKQYSVSFSVLDATGDVEIGLIAENATGNYLCIDNFKLQYTGAVSTTDHARELQKLTEQAQALLDKGIQHTVAELLKAAMNQTTIALQGAGTDAEGNPIYDKDALTEAHCKQPWKRGKHPANCMTSCKSASVMPRRLSTGGTVKSIRLPFCRC